jgi:hypothetical protein
MSTMPSHPNRSKTNIRAGQNPKPAQIARAREAAGLDRDQAAAYVYANYRTWQNWELEADTAEHRRMHPATWELFQIKLAAKRLLEAGEISPALLRELGIFLPEKTT